MLGNSYDNIVSHATRSNYADINVTAGATAGYSISLTNTGFYINSTFYSFGGSTDLNTLFDFYRIDRVDVTWMCTTNISSTVNITTALPFLFAAIDYNDGNIPNMNTVTQLATCEMAVCGITANPYIMSKSFTPRASLLTYGGAVSGYAESPLNLWYANTDSTVSPVHYGVKFVLDSTQMTNTSGTIATIRVFVKTSYSLKGPK